jgi:hypothetical protein
MMLHPSGISTRTAVVSMATSAFRFREFQQSSRDPHRLRPAPRFPEMGECLFKGRYPEMLLLRQGETSFSLNDYGMANFSDEQAEHMAREKPADRGRPHYPIKMSRSDVS